MQDITATLLAERDWLAGFARRLVSDAAAADDLIQETWLTALRRPPAHLDRPRGWLASVMRSLATQGARGDGRRERRERAAAHPEALEDVSEALERSELEQRVAAAVAALGDDQREAIVLRYREGWSTAKIAAALSITESAVRSRQHRGLEVVRAELERQYPQDHRAWALALIPLASRADRTLLVGRGVVLATAGLAVAATLALTLGGPPPEPRTPSRPSGTAPSGPAPTLAAVTGTVAPADRAPTPAERPTLLAHGKLVDDGGRPHVDREVTVLTGLRGDESQVVVRTDRDGAFHATLARLGIDGQRVYGFTITDPRLAHRYVGVTAEESDRVDLGTHRLPRCGAVRFEYIAADGSRPSTVQGARVDPDKLADSGPLARPGGVSTEWPLEGGVGLRRGLSAGHHVLWVRGRDDRWTRAEFEVQLDAITDLGPLMGRPLSHEQHLTLELIGPDGQPLADLPYDGDRVRVTGVGDGWFLREDWKTAANGCIALPVDDRHHGDLVLSSWSHAFDNHRIVLGPHTPPRIRVELRAPRSLVVDVVDAAGRPVSNARITARPLTSTDSTWLAGQRYLAQESQESGRPADAEGSYRVRRLARPFQVGVALPDRNRPGATVQVESLDVTDPEALDDRVQIVLPFELRTPAAAETDDEPSRAVPPREIRGRLTSPSGWFPPATTVALVEGDRVIDSVRSTSTGEFWLSGSAGDDAALVVLPYPAVAGFEATSGVAENRHFRHALSPGSDDDEVLLELPEPAGLRVRLDAGEDGAPWQATLRPWLAYDPGAVLQLETEVALAADEGGSLSAQFVPLDGATLVLTRPATDGRAELSLEREVNLRAGERTELVIDLSLAAWQISLASDLAANQYLEWTAVNADGLSRAGELRGPLEAGTVRSLDEVPTGMLHVRRMERGDDGVARTVALDFFDPADGRSVSIP